MDFLLNIAIGDAYGAPFEFASKEFVNSNNNGTEYYNGIGRYTDDTQMSIAIAEHMIDGARIDHISYARYFMKAYERDKRRGYSKRIMKLLDESEHPADFCMRASQLQPRNSNGCVMRVLPIGLYPDVETVKHAAIIQATLTHPTLECIQASMLAALTVHHSYYSYSEHLTGFILDHMNSMTHDLLEDMYNYNNFIDFAKVPIKCDALQTILFCIGNNRNNGLSLTNILTNAVKPTGDVDSTAAVSLGLASFSSITKNDLSIRLHDKLENGEYGRDYIKTLDEKLFEKFPRK